MSEEKRYYNGTKKEWICSWLYPFLSAIVLGICLIIVPSDVVLILGYIVFVFFYWVAYSVCIYKICQRS